jgi:hypothetical protein
MMTINPERRTRFQFDLSKKVTLMLDAVGEVRIVEVVFS